MTKNVHKLFNLGLASLAALMLLAIACSSEGEQRTEPMPEPDNSRDTRDVLLTLKNRLAIITPGTKVGDQPIATTAENAISTLDVYVFAADEENGEYSFMERFAYRTHSSDKLPKGAAALQLNASATNGKETTGLLKLKKGLFVKLYCIANDTAMFDPTVGKTVMATDFTPLVLSGGENEKKTVATPGKPLESTFASYHTHLLTANAKTDTIVTPLAMSGALTAPLDLTDFGSAARIQAGMRLSRLVARYDIENQAADSRFTIETVSIGNARRGSGSPNMQPGIAEKDSKKTVVSLQNKLDTLAKTITIYQLPGVKAATCILPITVTSLGGSTLVFEKTAGKGDGIVLNKTEDTKNTAEYTIRPALNATDTVITGVLHVKNYTQPDKMTDYAVTILRSDLTGGKEATLTVNPSQSVTVATGSPEGFKASITNWGGGGAWFDLPVKEFGKGNANITVKVNASLGNISIKPATVTLTNNIADGGNLTFTVTPALGTPVVKRVSALPTGNTPSTNNATLANNTALTLYKLTTATNYVLSATCYGGSKAVMSGSGFTLSPNNSVSNNVTQNYTLTATATSGSGSVTIYNADSKKPVVFPVTIKNGVMSLDKSEITLTPINGRAQSLKLTSGAGYKSYTVNWNGGTSWFSLPSSVAGGTNVAFNVTANTANSNPKEATVTLVNAVAGAPNITNLRVKVGATTPRVSSYSSPSVAGNTGSGQNISLWAVHNSSVLTNSSINVTIDAVGGSYVYSQSNVTVTGGNTTNQLNTFTVKPANGTNGEFVIANKIAPTLRLKFTVTKKSDAITANNLNVEANVDGSTNIPVSSQSGVTASVVNWGKGGSQWFNITTNSLNSGSGNIVITQTNNNANVVMKPATLRLTSKATGGVIKDITITPTGFVRPYIDIYQKTVPIGIAYKNVTVTGNLSYSVKIIARGAGGIKVSSSNTAIATVALNNDVITVTPKAQGTAVITVANASNESVKSTHNLTVSAATADASYNGKQAWLYNGYKIAPDVAMNGTWYDAQKACPEGWHVPSVEECLQIFGITGRETTPKEDGRLYYPTVRTDISKEMYDNKAFNDGPYWTSTVDSYRPNTDAWQMRNFFGRIEISNQWAKTDMKPIRCVSQ